MGSEANALPTLVGGRLVRAFLVQLPQQFRKIAIALLRRRGFSRAKRKHESHRSEQAFHERTLRFTDMLVNTNIAHRPVRAGGALPR